MITPRCSYRLQLQPGFGFREAAAVVDYLRELGVSHLYLSPFLQATPGSSHGYDVVDHDRVSRDLGGEEAHGELVEAARAAELGQVMDLVPNHMAIGSPDNAWWWDVLENGPSSLFSPYFDVDWEPPEEKLHNRVLLPVLPDHYGRVLEAGGLRIVREGHAFLATHGSMRFPLSPRSVGLILERASHLHPFSDLHTLAPFLEELPAATVTDPQSRRVRSQELASLKEKLARLIEEDSDTAEALDLAIDGINRDPNLLDLILEEQNYRLAFWRTGNRELDYRRFFDIDHLAALRVESPEVFAATHALALSWVREGVLDGLRIDHVDGLRSPRQYLERLRAQAPRAWIVVEKILEPGESLPTSWPVDGTTGYDFLNDVGRLFVDPDGERALTSLYLRITGDETPWQDVVRDAKHWVLEHALAADLNRLTHIFVQVCERNRRFRDFTRFELREALREAAVSLPVYRTYVPESGHADPGDLEVLEQTFALAREHAQGVAPELLGFLQDILSGRRGSSGDLETELRMQFQQLTGPVMAKGVEDTALYTFLRFVALNEVGGDPLVFGVTPEAFHLRCVEALEKWPRSMLALSTHDTKRSEDVRARLAVLSEIPQAWGEAVQRWMEMNQKHRKGPDLPDARTEYLLYQTLVGAHPLSRERAETYLEKAVREAKTHTSWTDPNQEYEDALRSFLAGIMADPRYQDDLAAFVEGVIGPGRINSLAQKLLQLTAPGVPDLYQGTELWDLSLVDPDNRRPVDFPLRRRVLSELESASPDAVLGRMERGDPKMWVVRQALALRRERPEALGAEGGYRPLSAEGRARGHVVAFLRGDSVLTVVPRLVAGLLRRGGWGDTTLPLPEGRWVDRMTGDATDGGSVPLAKLLRRFPVALLTRM